MGAFINRNLRLGILAQAQAFGASLADIHKNKYVCACIGSFHKDFLGNPRIFVGNPRIFLGNARIFLGNPRIS